MVRRSIAIFARSLADFVKTLETPKAAIVPWFQLTGRYQVGGKVNWPENRDN